MKKSIIVFFVVLVIAMIVIVFIPIYKNYNTLDIVKLETKSVEYGSVKNEEVVEKNYEMYYQNFECENEFFNSKVNEFVNSKIESFIEKNSIENRVLKKDKAVFLQSIDTYKVNDNIVSAKIITKIKDLKKDEYNTEITTFNCNLIESKELLLDELFQSEYKEKIADIYSEKYFLTQNAIVFLKRRR